jgi:NAD(P)H dehydrogenase (quinone)
VNTLIVHAHPEPRSFNRALTDVAVELLTAAGGAVQVSDLYAIGFKATADADDFGEREDPEFLRLDREQTYSHERAAVAADIRAEQEKVAWADLLILQYPMWWFGPPAILKGWADRVFTRGFAYAPGRKYDTGLMRGKRAMLSVTTGTSADTYAPDGIDGALLDILWPVHNGLLRYCGFDVLAPYVTYMPRRLDEPGRAAALDGYRAHLAGLDDAAPLFFHPATDYGADERLLPHVVVGSGFQHR